MRIIDLIPEGQRKQLIQELIETATAEEKQTITELLAPINEDVDIEKVERLARERNNREMHHRLGGALNAR